MNNIWERSCRMQSVYPFFILNLNFIFIFCSSLLPQNCISTSGLAYGLNCNGWKQRFNVRTFKRRTKKFGQKTFEASRGRVGRGHNFFSKYISYKNEIIYNKLHPTDDIFPSFLPHPLNLPKNSRSFPSL